QHPIKMRYALKDFFDLTIFAQARFALGQVDFYELQ
mgnify:CR=1